MFAHARTSFPPRVQVRDGADRATASCRDATAVAHRHVSESSLALTTWGHTIGNKPLPREALPRAAWLRGEGRDLRLRSVAMRDGAPTAVIIGELKFTFTLDLVLQAVDRSVACDEVWLAVRASGAVVAASTTGA